MNTFNLYLRLRLGSHARRELSSALGLTRQRTTTMWTLGRSTSSPESYQAPSQFPVLPRVLSYASGLTSDFPIDGYPHCTDKPSLKIRILCLASVFGIVGSTISQPLTAPSYFTKEVPIARAGLLANIGPGGSKSSGANVCRKHRRNKPADPVSVWDSHCQSEYHQPELSVHLGPRLVTGIQGYSRSIYSWI